jgi:tRNA A-37 threonylcarbamoyl transferase component Bud32
MRADCNETQEPGATLLAFDRVSPLLPSPRMAGRMFIAESWRALLQRHGLDSPDSVWNSTAGRVQKSAPSTEVRRIELGEGESRRVIFAKKYWATKASQLWSGMFRGTLFGSTKVRREFANLAQIRALGLQAPEPVAWAEIRRAGFVVRSFLITESVPEPVMPLDRFIRDVLPALPPGERRCRRRELTERLADTIRHLHEQGFVHRDLYWRNIILGHGGELDAFYLIDAHASQYRSGGLSQQDRIDDLATLDAPAPWFLNRTDRLYFLLRYTEQPNARKDSIRGMVQAILRAAEPIRDRQLKRVRELRG